MTTDRPRLLHADELAAKLAFARLTCKLMAELAAMGFPPPLAGQGGPCNRSWLWREDQIDAWLDSLLPANLRPQPEPQPPKKRRRKGKAADTDELARLLAKRAAKLIP